MADDVHTRMANELLQEALRERSPRRAAVYAAAAQVHATLALTAAVQGDSRGALGRAGTSIRLPAAVGVPAGVGSPGPTARDMAPAASNGAGSAAPGPLAASGETLFERLKGRDGISAAVQEFYMRVVHDPQLGHYFEGVEMWRLQRHMVAFLVQATGGPRQYDGRDMATAHSRLRITSRDFDRVAGHLVGTLQDFGVGPQDVDAVVAAIGPLKPAIVNEDGLP